MILIGTMNITLTRDRGDFFCPHCGKTETYRLRSRRPFLTLYFIPTVPVGGAELFVQCDQCRQTWDPTVLEMDQEVHQHIQEDQFREEALRAAVLVVIADGDITENEITALQQITERLLERPLNREELGELCSIAEQNQIEAVNYVLTVSHRWSESQKLRALQVMFMAATADRELDGTRMKILSEMRDTLELTNEQYQQAIEEALAWETASDA